MTVQTWVTRKIGNIDEATLAHYAPYIAGFLDGEGTFTIRWNRRARRPSFIPLIMVSHTNEEVIKLLGNTLKVDYTRKVRKKGLPYYVLRVTTKDDIVKILEALSSSLIVKKEHAEIILKLITLKGALKKRKGPADQENVSEQAKLYLRIRQLNPKGRHFDPDELRSAVDDCIRNYFKNK